jgi:hypothetical protein
MPFNLVCVNDGMSIVLNEQGEPLIFDAGAEAAARAAALELETGKKYQPRRAAANDEVWKQRERARFDSGHYRHVLFANEDWYRANPEVANHFLHVSNREPEMVAFTENSEMGHADRQTRMRIGRYLERFFPAINERTREYLIRAHMTEFATAEIHITQNADEIEWAYCNGPHSCMAYAPSHFLGSIHPTRVYAGPDLALAFMKNDAGRVSSRAIVWPERKIIGRVYGDMVLQSKLMARGWTTGSMNGARIQKIVRPGREQRIVAPYIDGGAVGLYDRGDFMEITGSDDYDWYAQNTDGTANDYRRCECGACGRRVTIRNTREVVTAITDGQPVTQRWGYECGCQRRIDRENAAVAIDNRFYVRALATRINGRWMLNGPEAEAVIAASTFVSDQDGGRYPIDQRIQVRSINDDGSIRVMAWTKDQGRRFAMRCQATRHLYIIADIMILSDGTRWNRRKFERDGAAYEAARRLAVLEALPA